MKTRFLHSPVRFRKRRLTSAAIPAASLTRDTKCMQLLAIWYSNCHLRHQSRFLARISPGIHPRWYSAPNNARAFYAKCQVLSNHIGSKVGWHVGTSPTTYVAPRNAQTENIIRACRQTSSSVFIFFPWTSRVFEHDHIRWSVTTFFPYNCGQCDSCAFYYRSILSTVQRLKSFCDF